jgi:shikimate dehydrogenase
MIRGAVLGGDVSKSRSPAIHLAAFQALGVEGEYRAFSVDPRGFRPLVRRLVDEGYRYLNVTIPHKRAAAAMADVASPVVRTTGAANTLILSRTRGGKRRVRAENTDGYGLVTALGDLGVKLKSGQVHVLVGSGGAAAGGLAALLGGGARVRLVARRTAPARALVRGFPLRQRAHIEVLPWTEEGLRLAVEGATSLISAVPAAAWASEEACLGLRAADRRVAVLEMAYGPATPLRAAARRQVSRYQDGIPMLVHQAARAVALALGTLPPAAPLLAAAGDRP